MIYAAAHVQKDGRLSISSAHKFKDCHNLKSRDGVIEISDQTVVSLLRKCEDCVIRLQKETEK